MHELDKLAEKIKQFNVDRDWDQFHNPKDLLVALVSEVGELADCYRWLSETEMTSIHTDPAKKKKVEEEIADIMMYLIILSYKTNIDIVSAVEEKLEKNIRKYPVEKAKGVHSNSIEGFKGKE
jgi:NTP pyrophosphatase (non-canonical NTP hydrolase)